MKKWLELTICVVTWVVVSFILAKFGVTYKTSVITWFGCAMLWCGVVMPYIVKFINRKVTEIKGKDRSNY